MSDEHSGSRGDTPRNAAPELLRRIQAVFDRIAVAFPDLSEPTFKCPDCLDRGWIMVPCVDPKCLCARIDGWAGPEGHQLARACLSCETGVMREAGIWFRFLYQRDKKGKPELVGYRVREYEQAMFKLGGAAKRVQLALDSILDREKGGRPRP